jgi:hypothetical protein
MVKALFDQRQLSMLHPFASEPTTITDAARKTETLPTTMLQFVRRMERGGLLREADTVRRSGKRVRQYWTTAKEFFVPIDSAEDVILKPQFHFQRLFNEALRSEILDHHYNVQPLGALFKLSSADKFEMQGTLSNGTPWDNHDIAPLVGFRWDVLKLKESDAKHFQREMTNLIETYRARSGGLRNFYVGAHLAPVPATHALR